MGGIEGLPSALIEIESEYKEQRMKFGSASHNSAMWCVILQEKIGAIARSELNRHFYNGPKEALRKECIKLAVMCAQMAESIDRNEG